MSWESLSIGQDLAEQARIRKTKLEVADIELYEKYCDAGEQMTWEEWQKRKSEPLRPDAPRLIDHPAGLALSGGGIRSATFNLGLLQSLASHRLLEGFDYLSTVSGGGYIGGFWSRWRGLKRAEDGSFPRPDNLSIRHLRGFSNFLRPRLSMISFETGRMATAFLAGVLPAMLVTLAAMTMTLLAWLVVAHVLLDLPLFQATAALAGVVLLAFGGFHLAWRAWSKGEQVLSWERLIFNLWMVFILAVAAGLWLVFWNLVPLPLQLRLAPTTVDSQLGSRWGAAVLPAAALLIPVLVLVASRALLTGLAHSFTQRRLILTTLESALSRALFLALVWLGLGTAWFAGQVVAGSGVSGIVGALSVSGAGSGFFIWARRFLRPQPNKPGGGKLLSALGTSSIQFVAFLTLLALLLLVASMISKIYGSLGLTGLYVLAGASFLLLLFPFAFNPQEVGFHSFYRQRLARAYLGAAAQDRGHAIPMKVYPRATQECSHDDCSLDTLPVGPPFHLICCAANDLAGDPIETLHRGAESAVLSRSGFQVRETWKPWAKGEAPLLGSAVTASAAAFNSHMGAMSMKLGQAATFLLTALNLRLGLWIDNPRAGNRWSNWLPPFYRELLGLSDLRASQVHLSDGAHFENLALYELVRRRCPFILVSDCGADPDLALDDFANAVRRIRTDFGVGIDLDTRPLRPDDDGQVRQSVVSGSLYYPDGAVGVLVLVKPSLTGDEPPDVIQYARRNQDFPQETTADQFYDEEQWEAYRRLGEHVMGSALGEINHLIPEDSVDDIRLHWALTQGQQHWMPKLDLDAARCLEIDKRWTRLESRLGRDSDVHALAHDVLAGDSELVGKGRKKKGKRTQDDAMDTLRYVQIALHQMESLLRTYQLDHGEPRPQNHGWFNRIGRWATADGFRTWWPWLAPTVTRRLRNFLQFYFALDSLREAPGEVEPIEPDAAGYAMERGRRDDWRAKALDAATHFYGYFLPMLGSATEGRLMAACIGVEVRPLQDKDPVRCSWNRSALVIPTGLWGAGIAEAFVPKLCERLIEDHADPDSGQLELLATFDSLPQAAELTVYRGAQFEVRSRRAVRRHPPPDLEKPADRPENQPNS